MLVRGKNYWRLVGLSLIIAPLFVSQSFLAINSQRVIGSVVAIGLMVFFVPSALVRFRLPRLYVMGIIGALFVLENFALFYGDGGLDYGGPGRIFRGVFYVFCIAFFEEAVSRGLQFALFERFGVMFALWATSIIFGCMHFMNYIGRWDFPVALNHVSSAIFFGFLMGGLMWVTRSIWTAVALHFMADFKMGFRKMPVDNGGVDLIGGGIDWRFVLGHLIIGAALGSAMVKWREILTWAEPVLVRLKLVEA